MKNKLKNFFNLVKVKKYNKNKIVNIILVSVFFILLLVILGLGVNSFIQKRIVMGELELINDLNSSLDTIDEKIKAKGNYGKVEKAMKEYYKDYFEKKRIFNNNRAETLFNTFTIDYLKENKNKLENLKLDKMVDTKTNELNDAVNEIIGMLDKENIMEYVYKYDLNFYYNNFYCNIMVSNNDSKIQENWKYLMDKNSERANYLKQIIDILVDNNKGWYIKDNNLYFSDDTILEEYNELHSLIYEDINLDKGIIDISF